jgi:hypothetical protein
MAVLAGKLSARREDCAQFEFGQLAERVGVWFYQSRLTSLPDPVFSSYRRPRHTNSNTNRDGTELAGEVT